MIRRKNSHDFVVIDRKTMTCDLDKTKKGEYTVNIISASEDDIGKVTLSVNSQKHLQQILLTIILRLGET